VDLTPQIYKRSFSLKTTGCEGAEWKILLRIGPSGHLLSTVIYLGNKEHKFLEQLRITSS
jgi:hypothetical protein